MIETRLRHLKKYIRLRYSPVLLTLGAAGEVGKAGAAATGAHWRGAGPSSWRGQHLGLGGRKAGTEGEA